MLSYQWRGTWVTNQVQVIGIDEKIAEPGERFRQVPAAPGQSPGNELRAPRRRLRHPRSPGRRPDARARGHAPGRLGAIAAAWPGNRRSRSECCKSAAPAPLPIGADGSPARTVCRAAGAGRPVQPPASRRQQVKTFDPAKEQNTGVVLGIAMSQLSARPTARSTSASCRATTCKLTFPTAGTPPKAVSDNFTIVDFYESKMLEYDSRFVFVPIQELQQLRGMIDPSTGVGLRQRHRDQAPAGGRRQRGPRQAAGGLRPGALPASRPGATSKAPCWPPCRWRPRSSTCCCS